MGEDKEENIIIQNKKNFKFLFLSKKKEKKGKDKGREKGKEGFIIKGSD